MIHSLTLLARTASTNLISQVSDGLFGYADAGLLRRLRQNLTAYAIKHTTHGEIVIGTRESGAAEATECWVRDNGTGIPEEFLKRLFAKGESHTDEPGGMGFGLAIAKTIVDVHGGTLTAENKEGGWFDVPVLTAHQDNCPDLTISMASGTR